MSAKPIPDGYDALVIHFVVRDAKKAIKFYKEVFGATGLVRLLSPDGKQIMHVKDWHMIYLAVHGTEEGLGSFVLTRSKDLTPIGVAVAAE